MAEPDPIPTLNWQSYQNIVVLTGAGISVASGIPPFRGEGGLWNDSDMAYLSQTESIQEDPRGMWWLHSQMREKSLAAKPNPAHLALAELEERLSEGQTFTLITQNIDGLHRRAGSRNVVAYHGSVTRTRCANPHCDLEPFEDDRLYIETLPECPRCGALLRPDTVFFGEMIPAEADLATRRALREVDLFLAVGTSGQVYPAAGFVRSADYAGARTILVNLDPLDEPNPYFHEEYLGRAEEVLPRLLGFA